MATPKAPTWYLPGKASNSELGSIQNALLPYLSAEGQIKASSNLASGDPTNFLSYKPYDIKPPTSVTPELKKQYLSRERAERTLSALNRMRAVAGINNPTAGYKFLEDTVNALRQYGGQGKAMSRKQYQEFTASIDAMKNSQAATDAGEYATLSGYFSEPTISGTPTMPASMTGGRTRFGNANKKLFG